MKATTLLLAAVLAFAGVVALAPAVSAEDGCVTNNHAADFCSDHMECPGYLWTIWLLGSSQDYSCA